MATTSPLVLDLSKGIMKFHDERGGESQNDFMDSKRSQVHHANQQFSDQNNETSEPDCAFDGFIRDLTPASDTFSSVASGSFPKQVASQTNSSLSDANNQGSPTNATEAEMIACILEMLQKKSNDGKNSTTTTPFTQIPDETKHLPVTQNQSLSFANDGNFSAEFPSTEKFSEVAEANDPTASILSLLGSDSWTMEIVSSLLSDQPKAPSHSVSEGPIETRGFGSGDALSNNSTPARVVECPSTPSRDCSDHSIRERSHDENEVSIFLSPLRISNYRRNESSRPDQKEPSSTQSFEVISPSTKSETPVSSSQIGKTEAILKGPCNDDGISIEEGECPENTPKGLLFNDDGSLNLQFFKVFPCKNESLVHDRKNCPFYHSQRDRRRLPVTYKAEQCDDSFDMEGEYPCACPNDNNCDKCHNRHELLYHPDIYKQRFCSSYNHLECHRGRFCAFAHARGEIRCQLFSEEEERSPQSEFFMRKFKTLWCPYGIQHDWHGCLYAHTYQDCRRSPGIGYGSEPCPYWQKDLHSANYQKRCPYGPQCPYSHGSKEQLYHPAYYKTMPCADFKTKQMCPRGELCAFYHGLDEKRPSIMSPCTEKTTTTTTTTGSSSSETNPFIPSSLTEPIVAVQPTTVSSNSHACDYTKPIPEELMSQLQGKFMRPPLFNLDDFEAFGHASRVPSGRRSSGISVSHQGGSNNNNNNNQSPVLNPRSHFAPCFNNNNEVYTPTTPLPHGFVRPSTTYPASAPQRGYSPLCYATPYTMNYHQSSFHHTSTTPHHKHQHHSNQQQHQHQFPDQSQSRNPYNNNNNNYFRLSDHKRNEYNSSSEAIYSMHRRSRVMQNGGSPTIIHSPQSLSYPREKHGGRSHNFFSDWSGHLKSSHLEENVIH